MKILPMGHYSYKESCNLVKETINEIEELINDALEEKDSKNLNNDLERFTSFKQTIGVIRSTNHFASIVISSEELWQNMNLVYKRVYPVSNSNSRKDKSESADSKIEDSSLPIFKNRRISNNLTLASAMDLTLDLKMYAGAARAHQLVKNDLRVKRIMKSLSKKKMQAERNLRENKSKADDKLKFQAKRKAYMELSKFMRSLETL